MVVISCNIAMKGEFTRIWWISWDLWRDLTINKWEYHLKWWFNHHHIGRSWEDLVIFGFSSFPRCSQDSPYLTVQDKRTQHIPTIVSLEGEVLQLCLLVYKSIIFHYKSSINIHKPELSLSQANDVCQLSHLAWLNHHFWWWYSHCLWSNIPMKSHSNDPGRGPHLALYPC